MAHPSLAQQVIDISVSFVLKSFACTQKRTKRCPETLPVVPIRFQLHQLPALWIRVHWTADISAPYQECEFSSAYHANENFINIYKYNTSALSWQKYQLQLIGRVSNCLEIDRAAAVV